MNNTTSFATYKRQINVIDTQLSPSSQKGKISAELKECYEKLQAMKARARLDLFWFLSLPNCLIWLQPCGHLDLLWCFLVFFSTFPCGVLGQMWNLIPDLCPFFLTLKFSSSGERKFLYKHVLVMFEPHSALHITRFDVLHAETVLL